MAPKFPPHVSQRRSLSPAEVATAVAVLLTSAALTYGQGQVTFANTSSTLISTNSVRGGPPTGPISALVGRYYFALFSAPSGTVDRSSFSFIGAYATNTTVDGRLSGGRATVPGAPAGSYRSFLVWGWSANVGDNYAAVTNYLANPAFDAFYGESQIATV